jgi:hypothetical protein
MKIINNTDINNLILYAKKNLGIYKLVYKEKKRIYYLSIILLLISALILAINIMLVCFNINKSVQIICGILCLLTCFCTLILLKYIDNKTQYKHLTVQNNRFELLKRYYNNKNYTIKDIRIINKQLEKRINKIEKQKVTILIVISVMILPTWDIFVQTYFSNISLEKMNKFVFFSIVLSIFVLIIIRFLNKTLYLYEENFYIKNNIAIIENLIYINEYIIQEKEDQTNNGRRRR